MSLRSDKMRTQFRVSRVICITLFFMTLISITACGTFRAGVPGGFVGQWKCEELASDGETDTSFYEMRIEEDGHFSMYDFAAGNPGISGVMGNDTGSTIDCQFDMDDFDVPFCWKIDSEEAMLDYELKEDTLRLGHNDVWMVFHRLDGESEKAEQEETEAENPYSGVTTMDSADVEAFAKKVRKAYLSEDWKTISEVIDYPITMKQETKVNTEEEFLKYMEGQTIDPNSLKAMEEENCRNMFTNGQGICMADGEVWFLDVNFDGIEQTGDPLLKIITVQGLK